MAAPQIPRLCPLHIPAQAPVAAFHSLRVRSCDAVATCAPFGDMRQRQGTALGTKVEEALVGSDSKDGVSLRHQR